MPTRTISFVNKSTVVPQADFLACVKALQKQIWRDFQPFYGIYAQLQVNSEVNARVESIIILDDSDQVGALGYHMLDQFVEPIGFVFARTSAKQGASWTSCASHELLEQLSDPWCYLTAEGIFNGKPALFFYENCDPVEDLTYQINGVEVSDFVTPAWFARGLPAGTRYDFLNQVTAPFTLTHGGYASYSTVIGQWQQWFALKTAAMHKQLRPFTRRFRRLNKPLHAG